MNRYWIFQSRPDRYDLRQELYPGKIDSWDATRYRNFMEPGGIVFFWLSGEPEHRGIYGWGRITSRPYRDEDSYGVDVQYEQRFPSHISAERIQREPDLKQLLILRIALGTNFLINPKEALALARVANDPLLLQTMSVDVAS